MAQEEIGEGLQEHQRRPLSKIELYQPVNFLENSKKRSSLVRTEVLSKAREGE